MKAIIYPGKVSGEVVVPSSKSIGHRALICASLANGTSIIDNVSMSNDIKATIDCLKSLGAKIEIENDKLIVTGIYGRKKETVHLDANESGSTLRFLIPISSFLFDKVNFTGSKTLLSRPLDVYRDIYLNEKHQFDLANDSLVISGDLNSPLYRIPGDISSQFISGLLFLLPLKEHDSTIEIYGKYESKSYIDLTIQMLKKFGIDILVNDEKNIINIKGNQKYQPTNVTVEGDYSQGAFFLVLSKINNKIEVKGVNPDSLQGDKEIINIITALENGDDTIDLGNAPDLGPIVAVLASCYSRKIIITNIKRLRYKESDRVMAIEEELKKFNTEIYSDENNIYINGGKKVISHQEIDSHNDHRIFMSMAVLSTISQKKVIIDNPECVNKSYPNFIRDLENVGIKVELINE